MPQTLGHQAADNQLCDIRLRSLQVRCPGSDQRRHDRRRRVGRAQRRRATMVRSILLREDLTVRAKRSIYLQAGQPLARQRPLVAVGGYRTPAGFAAGRHSFGRRCDRDQDVHARQDPAES